MPYPETRFAWSGNVSLAYQVVGVGAPDVLYLQGYCSNVDLNWDSPRLSRFLTELARGHRLIVTDRRGWGCSERFTPGYVPDVDVLTDDILAVMDAAGSERAALVATYEAAIVASLFTAMYPERVKALVLIDPQVTYLPTDDLPWMPSLEQWLEQIHAIRNTWGTKAYWDAPAQEREWFARYARGSVTPGSLAAELEAYLHTDVTAVLPTIQAPTLVEVDTDSFPEVPPETGRYVASRIPGARVLERASNGGPHFHWYARAGEIVADVRTFLLEVEVEEADFDRVLATVLFTDIVDSTRRAATTRDRDWHTTIERHNTTVRTLLKRYRGVEIDTAGDGFFATFDGPARAVRCAMAIRDAVVPLGLTTRAGIHTGEVVSGGPKPTGLTVNITARVAALAAPSQVLVSQTVRDLMVGAEISFTDAGSHDLKGVPGTWRVYAAAPSPGAAASPDRDPVATTASTQPV